MAGRQRFKYAELPIMKYQVFDSQSRRFTNVPTQPTTTFQWPPEEVDTHGILDEQDHHTEAQFSDDLEQQPLESEHSAEKGAGVIEVSDDQDLGDSTCSTIYYLRTANPSQTHLPKEKPKGTVLLPPRKLLRKLLLPKTRLSRRRLSLNQRRAKQLMHPTEPDPPTTQVSFVKFVSSTNC